MGISYFKASKPILFNMVWETNSLQIYDLEKLQIDRTMTYEQQGAQGMGFSAFHVHNLDSIFLFSERKQEIVLSDTSGMVKDRIRFTLPDGYPRVFVNNFFYSSPPQIKGKELIVKVRHDIRPSEITAEELSTRALLMAINMEDGTTRLLTHQFPSDYLADGQKQLEYSVISDGKRTLVSLMGDHSIYFADNENSPMAAKRVKSQFFEATMPTFPKDPGSKQFQAYFFAKSRYESLVHDPFRKVYYRFGFPTIEVESEDHLRALRDSPGPFVVMVLDEELNLLTEREFQAGEYLPNNFFVGERGLYLSINHPDNPENEEDKLSFELIQLISDQ